MLSNNRFTTHSPFRSSFNIISSKRGFNVKTLRSIEIPSTRKELPNKYQVVNLPKVRIEDVYVTNFMTENSQLSEERTFLVPKSAENRFYYSEDNEILSLDGFFQVHKNLELYRKKKDKEKLREKLKEKVQKMEEMKRDASLSLKRQLTIDTGMASFEQLDSPTQLNRFHSTKTLGNRERFDEISLKRNVTAKELSGRETDRSNFNTDGISLILKSSQKTNERKKLGKGMMLIRTGQSKEVGTEQKFTEKEVHKHLFHMTLSPKKMKMSPLASQIEKNYEKMFKSPRVMDYAVDKCIKKGKDFLNNEDQSLTSRSIQDRSFRTMYDTRFYTENDSYEQNEGSVGSGSNLIRKKGVGKVIKEAIDGIDSILRKGNPSLPLPEKSKRVARTIKTRNKHALKFDTEHKRIVKDMIEQHSALSARIKKVNRLYQKEYGPSAIKNQNYISYYN